MDIIKENESNSTKFLGHFEFLELLIKNKNSMSIEDYIDLISFFIITKSIDQTDNITRFGELIKSTSSIVNSNQNFLRPQDIVNKNSNELFNTLFDPEHFKDVFLHESFYKNDFVLLVLEKLGMISRTLSPDWVEKIAKSIKEIHLRDPVNAALVSSALFQYLSQYSHSDELLLKLSTIEWVICKQCPYNWPLEWAGKIEPGLCKPSNIYSDLHECLIGCLKSVLEKEKCQLLKIKQKPTTELIHDSIKQLCYLQNLILNENLLAQQHDKIQYFFIRFYTLLRDNFDPNILKNLPPGWIYCREKKAFLNNENLAMNVHNVNYPSMYELPHIYQDDPNNMAFLKQLCGVPEYFSLQSLKKKLCELKKKFGVSILDESATNLCLNIINEIIYLNENKLDNTFQLKDLKKSSEFYLLDNNGIMREAKFFYSEQTGLDSNLEFFLLHEKINPKSFGIEDSRKMISQSIGQPFGQKEKLSNRIKKILYGYSKETDIFK